MADPDAPPTAPKRWGLPRLLALAFAAGVLLFAFVWLGSRHDYDFYTPSDAGTEGGPETALPAPIAPDIDDGSGASGLRVGSTPNATPAPAGSAGISAPAPAPVTPTATVPAANPAAGDHTVPVPMTRQAPRYPPEELRRGIGGTVQVRVQVAADGTVQDSTIDSGSGNRNLDRAALAASRRWTFQPATRGGQPVKAEVVVPIEFKPRG